MFTIEGLKMKKEEIRKIKELEKSNIYTSGEMTFRGLIKNADKNPDFPITKEVGDFWKITKNGKIGGLDVENGEELIYSINGWYILEIYDGEED